MKTVTIISYSNPNQDSRTLNFLRSVIKMDLNINLISLNTININNVNSYNIEIDKKSRFLFNWMNFYRESIKLNIEGDIFLAADLYSLPTAVKFASRNNTKLIYDSREIYSQLGTLSSQVLKQNLITKIEKHYIKYVDEIIVSGELDATYLKNHFKHTIEYSIIMNVPQKFNLKISNILRDKYNLQKKKIIIYQGAILKGRGIEKSIEAFINKSDYALIIIGSGPYLDEFKRKYKYENIIFTGAVDYDKLLQFTASADLGLALFEDISFSYKLALPNKLFEYAMANIPIIASDLPAIRNIYNEFEFGILLKYPFSSDEIYKAVNSIFNDPIRYKNVLKPMAEKYNYKNEEQKIRDLMNRHIK